LEYDPDEVESSIGVFVSEMIQSAEEDFLVAPSVVGADHNARLQPIENKGRVSNAVGFVVYISTDLNRSQHAPLPSH
jgi:hypothetical protein